VHDINGVARTIADINPDVIVIDLENLNRALREQELFPKVDDLVAPTPEEE
jgi:hypothetical protein